MLKLSLLLTLLALSACSTGKAVDTAQNAEDAYNRGQGIIDRGEYARATMVLDKFAAKYPYSKFTTPAELLRLKAAYLDEQYVLSETLGLRFINAHPDNSEKGYAQYLVAMSYYKQAPTSGLDQEFSHSAKDAFAALIQTYPNHPKSHEIKNYLSLLTNRIAKHEMLIGKFYYDKQLYIAAINRFTVVKNKYLSSTVSAESLYYLASSYHALKQRKQRAEVTSILQQQFSNSKWYKKSKQLI